MGPPSSHGTPREGGAGGKTDSGFSDATKRGRAARSRRHSRQLRFAGAVARSLSRSWEVGPAPQRGGPEKGRSGRLSAQLAEQFRADPFYSFEVGEHLKVKRYYFLLTIG
jgi:hypothetical protein